MHEVNVRDQTTDEAGCARDSYCRSGKLVGELLVWGLGAEEGESQVTRPRSTGFGVASR